MRLVDVTTGKPVDNFDIYAYYYDYIEREKTSRSYLADYEVYEEP